MSCSLSWRRAGFSVSLVFPPVDFCAEMNRSVGDSFTTSEAVLKKKLQITIDETTNKWYHIVGRKRDNGKTVGKRLCSKRGIGAVGTLSKYRLLSIKYFWRDGRAV